MSNLKTGEGLYNVLVPHVGEKYVFGALVPKNNVNWKGPWDCAEFVSWGVYQIIQKLYGCANNNGNPATADAWTGFWGEEVKNKRVKVITVEQAYHIKGAIVLRLGLNGTVGHIVVSDGKGGTIEAADTKRGVKTLGLDNRRWDVAILVEEIEYVQNPVTANLVKPTYKIYRYTKPLMINDTVGQLQRALKAKGYYMGNIDNAFGPQMDAAVKGFQSHTGLIPDGEVGPETAKALNVELK